MFHLTGKRIVITGGTAGIGLSMVEQLQPYNELIVVGRSADKLACLSERYPGITTVSVDLSRPTEVEKAAQRIAASHNQIDVLINNAAVQNETMFTDPAFDPSRIEPEIHTNFTSICLLTHKLLPALMASPAAVILNVNSALAITPKTNSAVYCATKAALASFTRSLRYQLVEQDIAVLQAFMPLVDTAMTAGRGGTKKMSAEKAAERILHGIKHHIPDHAIGKVKLLKLLHRLLPTVSYQILKRA